MLKDRKRRNRIYRILSKLLAVVVVFTTTYGMILPAVTVERDAARKMAGVYLEEEAAVEEVTDYTGTDSTAVSISREMTEAGAGQDGEEEILDGDEMIEEVEIPEMNGSESVAEEVLEAESELEPVAEDMPETESELESVVEDMPEAEPELESVAEDMPEAELERESIAEDMPESESELESVAEDMPEAESEPESIAEDMPEAESDPESIAEDLPEAESDPESIAEEPESVENEEDDEMTAAAGSHVVPVAGADYVLYVDYGPEAGIPAGAVVIAEAVEDEDCAAEALGLVQEQLSEESGTDSKEEAPHGEITVTGLFDLTFYEDGRVILPAGPVSIRVAFDHSVENETLYAVHFPGTGAQPETEAENGDTAESDISRIEEETLALSESLKKETGLMGSVQLLSDAGSEEGSANVSGESLPAELMETTTGDRSVSFTADSFSYYVIVSYTVDFSSEADGQIRKTILSAEGELYEITVTYDQTAGIPEGADLAAAELPADDPEYEEYLTRSKEALGLEEDISPYARIFDISIVDEEGVKVTPASEVGVEIRLMDVETDELDLNVVHFGENPEVMDSAVTMEEDAGIVSFETSSFSIYTVISNANTSDLGGKTFAIVNTHTKNAVLNTTQNENTRLQAESVSIMSESVSGSAGEGLGTVAAENDIVLWTFTRAENSGNTYYIQDPDGKYLNINSDSVTVSSEAQALTVTNKGNGEVRISCTISGTDYAINNWNNSTSDGFYRGWWDNNSEHFTLYELDKVVTDPHWATRLSVADVVAKHTEGNPVQNVVVYTRVWNENNGAYDYYGLDTDGNLVPVFDVGDLVGWQGEKDMEWNLIVHESGGEPTGYFDLNNGKGQYIHPVAGASTILGSGLLGLRFNGLDEGTFGTTIEGWDQDAYCYVGLKIDLENHKIVPGTGDDSMEFFFALTDSTRLSGQLSTVDTLNTRDSIKISVYNFDGRKYMSDLIGTDAYSSNHTAQFGLVKNNLAEDPVIAELFSSKNLVQSDVSHLFLSNVYSESGYYYYNASDNYAYLDGKDFRVYNQTGTYLNQAGGTAELHGNFFPFEDLDENNVSLLRTLYDVGDGTLTEDDPRYNELMYLVSNPEYQFGMEIDADFIQAKDGLDEYGNPVKYEFTGDDDLWVYIDGVLVLDIGGIHGAISGSIDFESGEVHVYSNNSESNYPKALQHKDTTIRAMFEEAGYSEEWLEEHFDGNTFKDYSTHTMKMYYMERGANASNLRVKFNLPVVEKGSFTVSKEVDKGQIQYSDTEFQYQAFYVDHNGLSVPVVPDYEDEDAVCRGAYYVNADGTTSTTKVDVKSDGTFCLKAGETVRFQMADDSLTYYVREYNIDTDTFEKVTINGAEAQITDSAAVSAQDTIRNRGSVNFVNTPKEEVLSKLSIHKKLLTDVDDPLTKFEFYVYLEDADGNFVPYNQGIYYIMKDGKYYHFENSYPVADGEGVERTAYKSGPYGTISDIPGGFTAVIEDLMPGTHFIVTERMWDNLPIKNSSNYVFVDKETDAASVNAITKTAEGYDIDGATVSGQTSFVTVMNRPIYRLSAKKVWGESIVGEDDVHGTVHVALYKKDDSGELELVEGTLKEIVAPDLTVDYFIPDENLDQYVVREVSVDDTVTPATITPIEENAPIVIGKETVNGESVDDTYIVSYSQGEKTVVYETYSDGGSEKNYYVEAQGTGKDTNVTHKLIVREDTITNGMRKLTVNKTDIDDNPLKAAVFTLLKEDKTTAVEGYEHIISGDEDAGNLLDGIYLPNGVYYLKELQAPAGYILLEHPLKITVSQAGITMYSDVDYASKQYTDAATDSPLAFQFSVVNNPGVALPNTGGPGNGIFYLSGLMLMGFAGAWLVMRRIRKTA